MISTSMAVSPTSSLESRVSTVIPTISVTYLLKNNTSIVISTSRANSVTNSLKGSTFIVTSTSAAASVTNPSRSYNITNLTTMTTTYTFSVIVTNSSIGSRGASVVMITTSPGMSLHTDIVHKPVFIPLSNK